MSGSALYQGWVMHRRLRPRMHHLKYRLFALLIDLDELDSLDRRLRLFSRNRFNLIGFHDGDYGDGSRASLRTQAMRHLAEAGIAEVGAIRLLTMPRLLGFAFNPLSLYFCEDRGGMLAAILYEVHNTFGERHVYVMPVEGTRAEIRQEVEKRFHVSPFLPMALNYSFRVRPPAERLNVAISVADERGPVLVAVQAMERRPLTDASLARAALAFPLMTVKVVAGILWEAAKLWSKGVGIHRHPGPSKAVTVRPVATPDRARAA